MKSLALTVLLSGPGWLPLTGCSSSDAYAGSAGAGGTLGGRRAGAGTGGSPTGASGMTTTSSSGSASSGSGGTAGGTCDPKGTSSQLLDCPRGQVEVVGNVVDFCMGQAPITETLTVIDTSNQADATTDRCGYFHFCVTAGNAVSAKISAPGYLPTQFATVLASSSEQIPPNPGIYLVCDSLESTLATFGFDPTKAAVIVNLYPLQVQPGDVGCDARFDGWTFAALTADGGHFIDAGVAYLSGGTSPDPFLTATTAVGVAVLYNLDPQSGDVTVLAHKTITDAGSPCANLGIQPPFQLAGSVSLLGGGFSYLPYVLP